MRKGISIALAVGGLAASGCVRSGNFSPFIVSEVAKLGGHTVSSAPLPALQARWTVRRDENGFLVSVSAASFCSIDAIMQQAFGPPKISVDENLDGQPHRVWSAAEIGVAIQLFGRHDGADVLCLRAMRDPGEMFESLGKRYGVGATSDSRQD